jgi:hypothetical protein
MCLGEIIASISYAQLRTHFEHRVPCIIQAFTMQFGNHIINMSLLGLNYAMWSNVSDSYVARNFKLNFGYWMAITVIFAGSLLAYAVAEDALGPAGIW